MASDDVTIVLGSTKGGMTHHVRIGSYDSKDAIAEDLRYFQMCYEDLKRRGGGDQAHRFWSQRAKSLRAKWKLFCEKYRDEHGEEFMHSPETLRRLRILHDIHDEEDLDYRGPRTLRNFDWTYALPIVTDFIRLTGATGKIHSFRNRDDE